MLFHEIMQYSSCIFPIRQNTVVVKNSNGLVFNPSLGIDEIGIWKCDEAYQVFLNQSVDLQITGNRILPENFLIHLEQGWNYIPYVRDNEMNIDEAFASIYNNILIVKDNEGKIFFPSLFLNKIENLSVGEGYLIYITNPVDFYYPENE